MKATVTQYERVWKYKNYYDEGHTGDPFDSYNSWIVFSIFFYMWMHVPTLCTRYILKGASAWIKGVIWPKGSSLTWKICWNVVKISYPKTVMFSYLYKPLASFFFYPENNFLVYSILGWSLERCSYQRFCLRRVNNSTPMNNEIHSWHFNV